MEKPNVVMFQSKDGKVYAGNVIYHEDWYDEWKKGKNPAIIEVIFDENNVPEDLQPENVPEIIDYCNHDFKDKIGMTWEEWSAQGCPNYEQIYGKGHYERGLRAKSGVIDDGYGWLEFNKKLKELKEKEEREKKKELEKFLGVVEKETN